MDINVKDNQGGTPLHWACNTGSEMALSYLLAFKPNINAQDYDGLTPMHLAVRNINASTRTRCVRLLLLKGAMPDIKDRRGKSPADYVNDVRDRDLQ